MSRRREQRRPRRVRRTPMVVLAVFLLIWIAGVSTGEPARVLEQAMQVCLSCIGLG